MSPILGARGGLSASAYGLFAPSLAGNSYESISTVTVGSGGSSSIDFTSITSTYKHLQIRCIVQTNRGTYGRDSVYMKVNAGTAGYFSWHLLMGEDGSSVTSQSGVTQNYMNIPIAGTSTGGSFGCGIIDILDYSNTNKYKTVRTLGGIDHNGLIAGYGGVIGIISGSYRDTPAITSINFTAPNNFTQYSQFALYGIKG